METYCNFEIEKNKAGLYIIYKNGNPIFTAPHQRCFTIEQAKAIIDSSIAAKEAFDKLPNKQAALKKLNTQCSLEVFGEKAEQRDSWMNREEEKIMSNY